MPTEKEIFEYSHRINGLVTETFAIFEMHINIILANYYCKDVNKVDDLVVVIQEISINKRIEFLFDDVIRNICPEIVTNTYQFKYLKADYNEIQVVKKFKNAIISFKDLRNLFSHYTTKLASGDELESVQIAFKLEKYYPKDGKGNKIKNATKYVLSFCEDDFLLLKYDEKILSELFYKLLHILINSRH